jgi:predicted metal-dependent phosphoesterase TrpH
LIKADFHIHTAYSRDCTMSLEQIIARCLEVGINCLAVADHNAIEGAIKLKEMAPFPIIVSEEILTSDGEIIGMFLTQEIPRKLSAKETVARIKAQGGLVCIPHPCDRLRFSVFRNQVFEDIMPEVDIIEVFNARSLVPGSSARAWELARKYGKLASAGSDAHTPSEIGNACVEMPEFNGKDEFLTSLAQGKISGNKSKPTVHFANTWARLKKRLS